MDEGDTFQILTSNLGKALLRNARKVSGTWLVPSIQSGRPALLVWDILNQVQRICCGLDWQISTRESLLFGIKEIICAGFLAQTTLPSARDPGANTWLLPASNPDLTASEATCQNFEGLCSDPPHP